MTTMSHTGRDVYVAVSLTLGSVLIPANFGEQEVETTYLHCEWHGAMMRV